MKEDRRERQRYPCIGQVEINTKQSEGPSQIVSAMLINISQKGIRCNATSPLLEGTRVSLLITEFMGEKITETMKGKISWISGSNNSYYMGIEFDTKLTPETHPDLCKLVCEHTQEKPDTPD